MVSRPQSGRMVSRKTRCHVSLLRPFGFPSLGIPNKNNDHTCLRPREVTSRRKSARERESPQD